MMQSMRNGIEKHFVRQLEPYKRCPLPQLLPYLSLHSIPVPILELHANWVIRERGRKGEKLRSTYLGIHHISCISFIVYHLSSTFATFSTFVFRGSDLLTCYQNCFLFDIYPTYLGRTQQPPVRVAGRRDPTMASAYPAAAVHAAPNDADGDRHSCADVAPNRRI